MSCLVGTASVSSFLFLALFWACAWADEECDATVGESCPASVSGALPGTQYAWSHQKGDVNRTGASPHVVPSKLDVEPSWTWKDPHNGVNRMTPLIDDLRNIYLDTIPGRIYKFSPDGNILWQSEPKHGPAPAVPAIMDGVLFANSRSGFVFAMSMETGEEIWATKVSSNGTAGDTACLFAYRGLVVSATEGGDGGNKKVVALNASTGALVWELKNEWTLYNFQASSPGDDTLLFMDSAGGLEKVNLTTGAKIWTSGMHNKSLLDFTTGAAVVGPNGIVYCASNKDNRGIIHAYRLSDGSHVWSRTMPGSLFANQAVAIGHVAGNSNRLAVTAGVGVNPGFPMFLMLVGGGPQLISVCLAVWACGWCASWLLGGRCRTCLTALPFFIPLFGILHFQRLVSNGVFQTNMSEMATPAVYNICKFAWAVLLVGKACCFGGSGTSSRPQSPVWRFLRLVGKVALLYAFMYGAAIGLHLLYVGMEGKPQWLWHTAALEGAVVTLDAETGADIWTYTPPPYYLVATAGDDKAVLHRLWKREGDPICLPDSWSQNTIGGDGTVYAAFSNGHLYALRDEDGDGLVAGAEVSEHDMGHGFQASHGLAPGMLAVVPCGGGLYVWKS